MITLKNSKKKTYIFFLNTAKELVCMIRKDFKKSKVDRIRFLHGNLLGIIYEIEQIIKELETIDVK